MGDYSIDGTVRSVLPREDGGFEAYIRYDTGGGTNYVGDTECRPGDRVRVDFHHTQATPGRMFETLATLTVLPKPKPAPTYDRVPVYVDEDQNPAIDWGVTVDISVNGDLGVHLCAVSREEAANMMRRAIRELLVG
jgi:hypothetical protein